MSPFHIQEHWCLKRSRGPTGDLWQSWNLNPRPERLCSCLSYDLKLVRTKGIKPSHLYTLCFVRSSLATLTWPHWIASIKGVKPHLSLQSGSYWHLEPKPKRTDLKKVTASNPMDNWLLTTCSRWCALQMIVENWSPLPLSLSQYLSWTLKEYTDFPLQNCSSSTLCHPILQTVISQASHAQSLEITPYLS